MTSNGMHIKAHLEEKLESAQHILTQAVAEISHPQGNKTAALRLARMAQRKYEQARLVAIANATPPGSLDEIIHWVNRQIPETHLVQANAYHSIGHSRYQEGRNRFDEPTRTAFSNAAGRYQRAYHAVEAVSDSYRTTEERYSRRSLLEKLYPGWASACFILGSDSANRGSRLINFPESGQLITPTDIGEGLDCIDAAIRYFGIILGMAEMARRDNVDLASFENRARSRLFELNKTAHRTAVSINDTERAAKYR